MDIIIQLTTVSKDSSHCLIHDSLRPNVSPNETRESSNLSIILSQNKYINKFRHSTLPAAIQTGFNTAVKIMPFFPLIFKLTKLKAKYH